MKQVLRGLTLYQPWAYAVATGLKTVENRKWKPSAAFLPPQAELWIAIHAGATYDLAGELFLQKHGVALLKEPSRVKGAILGIGRLVSCVTQSDHPMFFGPWGWNLDQLQALATPICVKGQMSLWELEPAHEAQLRALIPSIAP